LFGGNYTTNSKVLSTIADTCRFYFEGPSQRNHHIPTILPFLVMQAYLPKMGRSIVTFEILEHGLVTSIHRHLRFALCGIRAMHKVLKDVVWQRIYLLLNGCRLLARHGEARHHGDVAPIGLVKER